MQRGDTVILLGSERLHRRGTDRSRVCEWAAMVRFPQDEITQVLRIEDLSILLPE
jgi:hypothetical protein